MKTEHNNGANTLGFNCYSDGPEKTFFHAADGKKKTMLSTGIEAPV